MSLHIVFCGGGTAGHLYPGIAVAEQIAAHDPTARITFAVRPRGWEERELKSLGHSCVSFRCRPLPGRWWRIPAFAAGYATGVAAARKWLSIHQADVVVGLGGWTSVPMSRAAVLAGRPLVLLEQNALAGRVTRWLAPHAALVCAAMDEARRRLRVSDDRFRCTGNPLRAAITGRRRPHPGRSAPRLLVLGGSGGSDELNRAVPLAVARLGQSLRGWQVVHQTGAAHLAATRARYAETSRCVRLTTFAADVADEISEADIVVCRAGGTTLAELAALGAAAIVVPYAASADDHQRRNAMTYASAGACRMVDPRNSADLATDLACEIDRLASDAIMRNNLRSSIRQLARPDASAEVAELIMNIAFQAPQRSRLT
ncbi:MAG TPA: UDP-N-acetylglucosamine--N-acetylmuramyl-(pentapeptide) pyrophosphoryl-undecaprenol N-acetylglucosamine transferase [Pirellulales bacterium]|nr:UDP-N-acetylglucosamine--N-acetylmuramyl-(pentapeptide) pyrophosphoryl-undecaprenol N-acetylglucosamine transferase [Pirellulales bacterium]